MVKKLLIFSFLLLSILGIAGCSSGKTTTGVAQSREVSEVKGSIMQTLTELEQGNYRSACEDFTMRSRLAMAFAPVFDGHQSDSSCSDVFIVAGVLKGLGLTSSAAHLRAVAEDAGWEKQVNLSDAQAHDAYRGLGSTELATLGKMQIKEGTATGSGGAVIARYEGGRWRLEAVKAETTYREAREIAERRCGHPNSKSYKQLCKLLAPVLAGTVLTGRKHREFDRLLPAMFSLPRSTRHIFEDSKLPS